MQSQRFPYSTETDVLKDHEEVWDPQHVMYKLEDHWYYTEAEEHT